MSRMVRSAATVLLFFLLACSSLQALPFAARTPPSDTGRGNVWAVIVEWIGSIFTEPTDSTVPASAQPKEGSIMDPDGND